MGVHRFYEAVKRAGNEQDEEVTRYYYDDISDEVMSRTFKIDGHSGQKPVFVGEHRTPMEERPDEIRRKAEGVKFNRSWAGTALNTLEARVIEALESAVIMIEGGTHAIRGSVDRSGLTSRRRTPVWSFIAGVALIGYAMARRRKRDMQRWQ
ncbi:MAG TPA: hypothetical protein VJ692_06560 [Nitrospiraceae bacterium]|nr:hypothetical protein [Nitrospiraceae bacterium]